MTTAQIASTVLGFRTNYLPNLHQVREALGESYGEALNLGWLVPDFETGTVSVTRDVSRIEAMESLSSTVEKKPVEVVCNESWRSFGPDRTNMREIIVESDAAVGDAVTVADSGKSFSGVVKSINPDGTYELSFANEKPSKTSFKMEELNVTKQSDKSSASPIADVPPARPAVTGVLPVPGVG